MEFNSEKIRQKAIAIMLKHPNCFPIVQAQLFNGGVGVIFRHIGLDKVITKTIQSYDRIPIMGQSFKQMIPILQTTLLQEVLFYYFHRSYTEEDDLVLSYRYYDDDRYANGLA